MMAVGPFSCADLGDVLSLERRGPVVLVRSIASLLWGTMRNRCSVTFSGLVRALVLFGVLAGVFAMHALTMNHDAAMATMSGMSAAEASVEMPGQAVTTPLKVAAPKDQSASGQQMGTMCLAVLAASLLLLGLALLLGWLRSARFAPWLRQARPVHLSLLHGRSPPCLAPSLSKLCVLRT